MILMLNLSLLACTTEPLEGMEPELHQGPDQASSNGDGEEGHIDPAEEPPGDG